MSKAIDKLIDIMKTLRSPGGCPWDIEQNFKTIAPHTLEETYEVVEAIEQEDYDHLREELGDLLFQVIFHSQMASEQGLFTFDQVAEGIANKMIERHPHVFGDRDARTADDVLRNWEADKASKRNKQAEEEKRAHNVLEGVTTSLPAMSRALKLQQRAARVGFDWTDPKHIIGKIHEEADELSVELQRTKEERSIEHIEEELGDLFFVLVNLARHLKIDPERSLRGTNRKFEQRFKYIETALAASGRNIKDASLDEMEALWQEAKETGL